MEIGLVCDHCDAYNSLGASVCASCGAVLVESAAPPAHAPARPIPAHQQKESAMVQPPGIRCPQCGAEVPAGFRFCGACGNKLEEAAAPQDGAPVAKTLFFGAMQTPGKAKLILIKGQSQDGMTYYLSATDHVAGRLEGDIRFPEPDPLLSPKHANFFYQEGCLIVADEDSTNGVFIRIHQPISLSSGDTFLVGEQLLRVERTRDEESPVQDKDGTYYYASPRYPSRFQVVQLLHGGAVGLVYRAPSDRLTIGREGNDVNFPEDRFISGHHAQLEVTETGYQLTDMGSKNGTFLRIREPTKLSHGDYVFIGQQLLRVEIT